MSTGYSKQSDRPGVRVTSAIVPARSEAQSVPKNSRGITLG
ncbi:MAG: hypothetical protein AB4426_20765 [Xenococcaceae cyanobacterium]